MDEVAGALARAEAAETRMREAREELRQAEGALKAARAAHRGNLEHARQLAGLLRNTYDWRSGGEDLQLAPARDPLGMEREGTELWTGGELLATVWSHGDDGGEIVAQAIAEAGVVILQLASELEQLRAVHWARDGAPVPAAAEIHHLVLFPSAAKVHAAGERRDAREAFPGLGLGGEE